MRKRRRRKFGESEVQLNLAAMLDMAFQLLFFFVVTFKPPPVEGQISMRLPAPQVAMVTPEGQNAGSDVNNTNPVTGLSTLTISVFADPQTGLIESLGLGEAQVPSIAALDSRLREVFADSGNPFDQVIIQVSDNCRYDEVMKVMEVCSRQTLPNGEKLSRVSLLELPSG